MTQRITLWFFSLFFLSVSCLLFVYTRKNVSAADFFLSSGLGCFYFYYAKCLLLRLCYCVDVCFKSVSVYCNFERTFRVDVADSNDEREMKTTADEDACFEALQLARDVKWVLRSARRNMSLPTLPLLNPRLPTVLFALGS